MVLCPRTGGRRRGVWDTGDNARMIRIGVVGVNGIGQAHMWALRQVEGAGLAAVCDIDHDRAAKAATDHDVPVADSIAALAGHADAVVIATPAGTHPQLARAALDAGMHVYCEKPIATTSDEGYALHAYATERGRVVQVGFQFRFHKGYAAMRDALGKLGDVRRVHVSATNWFRAQRYFDVSPWRATWRTAGGGVLMNQAVHQLDALIAAVGMPKRVTATVRNVVHRAEVEDDASAVLEWGNGARGTLVASLSEPAGSERFEIHCEHGAVVLTDGYDVQVARHDGVRRQVDECPDEFPASAPVWEPTTVERSRSEWFDMLVAAHRDFAAAVHEGRSPSVDAAEGTKSVELANAFYLSSMTDAPVSLPLPEGAYRPVFEELATGHRVLRS
jgi:predicted dehydrogenase